VIIDASVALKWVVDEKGSEAAAALAGTSLSAPDLLLVECANALWAKTRRGELTPDEARERVRVLARSPVRLVPLPDLVPAAAELAEELTHPVYDCLYLALAIRHRSPLITADRRFVEAVQGHGRYRSRIRHLDD
jgi:predicted nucleic acid-binding protein